MKIIHLLIPKQFAVWCRPDKPVGNYHITNRPSKANCANCLTAFRTKTGNIRRRFKVSHTPNRPE